MPSKKQSITSRLRPAAIALALAATLAHPAGAQQQTAQLNGRVTDAGGAAIPDAIVTVANPATGFSIKVKTTGAGDYTVPLLQPADDYVITVDRDGFKQTVQKNVVLQVAQTAKIDLTLTIGAVDQVVTVTSAAPIIDAETSSIGQVITGRTVEDLPLNGRSTFRLIALTPGVTFNQSAYGQFGDLAINTTFDTNFSINGGRAQSNEILIDGVPSSAGFFDQITTLPNPDDTDQFKVEANNLSAQYGRYTGGAVNVSTKSGTNSYHGDVYDFFRNSALDANDWFLKQAGQPRPAFKLNIFGGTIGGPLSIPHLYNGKDHTFFFLDYQGARRIKGTPNNVLLPTDAQRQGIFGATNIYNPFSTTPVITTNPQTGAQIITQTRTQFAYNGVKNSIDPALFDPVALAIQKYFPEPNTNIGVANATTNYISASSVRVQQDTFSTRIDQNVSQKYHLFGRYAYSNSGLTQPNSYGNIADAQGAVGTTYFKNQSFAFDNIYSITPSLTLSVDYGFARWYQVRKTLSFGFDITTLGLPAQLASQVTIPMFPTVTIGGGFGATNNQSFLNNGNDSHALLASLTKTLGRHTIIGGVDGRFHKINFFNLASTTGTYGFAIAQTQGPNAAVAAANNGSGYASFLLGVGNSGSIPTGNGVKLHDFYGGAFLQDNWRVTERLTLNLGVRYDGESPYDESRNRLSYFDPNIASPLVNPSFPALKGGLSYAGVGGNQSAVYTRQHNNIAPRVGFAFSAHPTTVFRGGFGIAYGPLEIANNAVGFAPNNGYQTSTSWNVSNNGGFNPANLLRNPFPQGLVQPSGNTLGASTLAGQAINVWYNNPPTPRSYQYNFDIQQQLAKDTLLDVGYVGSRGLYLTANFDYDALNPTNLALGTGLTTAVPNPFYGQIAIGNLSNPTVARRQLLLPFPQFTSVLAENDPYGASSYNSLQTKLVKRASNGLTLLVSYTWSKLISNVNGSDAPIGSSNSTAAQNYYDLRSERSISEMDQPQNFIANATYQLPFGHGRRYLNGSGFSNQFIGGFKLNTIWSEQDGFPLTFSAATTGIPNARPNLNAAVLKLPRNRNNIDKTAHWFNNNTNANTGPVAVTTPTAYTFGNAPRAYAGVRSPGIQNVDASILKDNHFEHIDTEFRAEFFNVLNNPHFAAPNTAVQNAAFGTIKSIVNSPPERQIQFALKISF